MSSFPLCRWEKLNDLLTVNNWDKILNTCQIAVLESNKLRRMLGEMHILQVQLLNLYSKGVSRRYLDKSTWFYIVVAQTVKHLSTMRETRVQSLGREDLLVKEMATHSSILPGKSHEWRRLAGYSTWNLKELDMTEQLHFHFHCNLLYSFQRFLMLNIG